MSQKYSFFDPVALENFRKEHKLEPYRIKQITDAIFKQSIIDFQEMTILSKEMRDLFDAHFEIISLKVSKLVEDDETSKFLFETSTGEILETVLMYHYHDNSKKLFANNEKLQHKKMNIPHQTDEWTNDDDEWQELNRMTLCVSSQVWCAVGCIFCVTGKMWLKKNLHRTEILSQVLYVNNFIRSKLGKKEDNTLHKIRNVVFMGMGEPLMNYPAVRETIWYLTDTKYLWLSRKRVTLSTSGILKPLLEFIDDGLPVSLAFSLHAPTQELREQLIPIMAKVNPLDKLMAALDSYTKKTGNKIFYEYVMIKDRNDMKEVAHEMGKLLQHRDAHLNLIPYNQNPMIELEESTPERIKKFKDIVESYKVKVTVRENRGRKANSACGQLGWEKVTEKLSETK
jgi:23S rRNA (adenine2503-C2)-methyltransferase